MKKLIVDGRHTDIVTRDAGQLREDDIDLRAVVGVANDHKWLILVGTAVFFLAGVIYVLAAKPTYQASALVQVERGSAGAPGQSPQTSLTLVEPARSQAVTEIPLLTSRTLFSDAVNKLDLDVRIEPQRLPILGDFLAHRYAPKRPGDVAPPLFGLSRYGWGGEELHIKQLDVPDSLLNQPLVLVAEPSGRYRLLDQDGELLVRGRTGTVARAGTVVADVETLRANPGTRFNVTRLNPLAAISALADNIEATEQGRDSGIISVTYRDTDPAVAAQVLDHITSAYVRSNVQRNSAEAERSLQFVNEQLPKVR
jgi:tyrosine-protein kinase Etk/Wzc